MGGDGVGNKHFKNKLIKWMVCAAKLTKSRLSVLAILCWPLPPTLMAQTEGVQCSQIPSQVLLTVSGSDRVTTGTVPVS